VFPWTSEFSLLHELSHFYEITLKWGEVRLPANAFQAELNANYLALKIIERNLLQEEIEGLAFSILSHTDDMGLDKTKELLSRVTSPEKIDYLISQRKGFLDSMYDKEKTLIEPYLEEMEDILAIL